MSLGGAIFAIGGDGLFPEPATPLFADLALSLARGDRALVVGEPPPVPRVGPLSLDFCGEDGLGEAILSYPLIFLHARRASTLVDIVGRTCRADGLAEALRRGSVIVAADGGAGALFRATMEAESFERMNAVPGLGLLPGSFCGRYDTDPRGRPAFATAIRSGAMPAGWGLDDAAGLLVRMGDDRTPEVVAAHPDARAYRVQARNGLPHLSEQLPRYLGGHGLVIRRAARADARGIHAAHERSIRHLAAKDYTPQQIAAWTSRPYDAAEAARLADEIRFDPLWVIEQDGLIEGYAHMKTPLEHAPSVYLQALYLTPRVAGRGLARSLMTLAEAEARRRGAPRLLLHSSKTALGFYEALGYAVTGPLDWHHVAGVPLERWPMEKVLD